MPDDACPLPTEPSGDESKLIERLLSARRVAVVGLSDDPGRASFAVASYLLAHGYDIVPVNPKHARVTART